METTADTSSLHIPFSVVAQAIEHFLTYTQLIDISQSTQAENEASF